jgi:O-antigen ligase
MDAGGMTGIGGTGEARTRLGTIAARAAYAAFAIAVVVSPNIARLVLEERPAPSGVARQFTDIAATWGEVAILATLAAWVVSLAAVPRPVRAGPRIVALPVLALLAWMWAGVPFSIDPPVSAWAALGWTMTVGLGLYVINEVRGVGQLVGPVAVLLAVQATVAIGQSVTQGSIGLGWLGERVLDPGADGASIVAGLDGTRWLRAHGLTAHPNVLGGLLAFGMLVLATWITTRRDAVRRSTTALAALLVVGISSAALVLSFSRSAWLAIAAGALAGGALLWAWRARGPLRRWTIVLVVAAGIAVPVGASVGGLVVVRTTATAPVPTEVRSVEERLALAEAALAIVADRPVFGSGLGTQPLAFRLADPGFAFAYAPAHMVILDAAAETGLPGALAFLAAALAPAWLLLRGGRRSPELAGASAVLLAVLVVGLFDHYPWTRGVGRTWMTLAFGLWIAAWIRARRAGDAGDADAEGGAPGQDSDSASLDGGGRGHAGATRAGG